MAQKEKQEEICIAKEADSIEFMARWLFLASVVFLLLDCVFLMPLWNRKLVGERSWVNPYLSEYSWIVISVLVLSGILLVYLYENLTSNLAIPQTIEDVAPDCDYSAIVLDSVFFVRVYGWLLCATNFFLIAIWVYIRFMFDDLSEGLTGCWQADFFKDYSIFAFIIALGAGPLMGGYIRVLNQSCRKIKSAIKKMESPS